MSRREEKLELRRNLVRTATILVREQVLAAGFMSTSCVLSVSCLLDVLRHFGIHGKAMKVHCTIWNQLMIEGIERAESEGRQLTEGEVDALHAAGGWGVGIGVPGVGGPTLNWDANSWNGHLVVVTRNPDLIVDPSLDQASRPAQGILVGPGTFPMQREWLRGGPVARYSHDSTEAVVEYVAYPDDHSYRAAPDWHEPTRRLVIVPRVIEALENLRQLAAAGDAA